MTDLAYQDGLRRAAEIAATIANECAVVAASNAGTPHTAWLTGQIAAISIERAILAEAKRAGG